MTAPALMLAIVLVASTLSGECGQVGPACHVSVARTMANRVQDGVTLPDALSAYYARGEPTARTLGLATVLVLRPRALAGGGWRYCWSDEDARRWGWGGGDATLCGGGLCIHLARRWPGW